MKAAAIIVAAGSSERFGGPVPKQFVEVAGRPLLAWTIARFEAAELIDTITVVVAEESLAFAREKVLASGGFKKVAGLVAGGATRRESVRRGLEQLPRSTSIVAIHDGARPLVAPTDIDAVVKLAGTERAAMLAVRTSDTVKRVREGYVMATLDRSGLYLAQTPQVFQYDLIMEAHRKAADDADVTDDASLVEALGFKVRVLEPTTLNLKVTTRQDLAAVGALLKEAEHGRG